MPVVMALMFNAVDEQGLRPMRERRVIPGHASLDDIAIRNVPQASLAVREFVGPEGVSLRNVVDQRRRFVIFFFLRIEQIIDG